MYALDEKAIIFCTLSRHYFWCDHSGPLFDMACNKIPAVIDETLLCDSLYHIAAGDGSDEVLEYAELRLWLLTFS